MSVHVGMVQIWCDEPEDAQKLRSSAELSKLIQLEIPRLVNRKLQPILGGRNTRSICSRGNYDIIFEEE